MSFNPTQLPQIDAVDVVNLVGIHPGDVSKYMRKAAKAPYVQVAGELAQQIADLWRQLPPGMQARCHVPPFGLRFYLRGEVLLQASVCWQCNNIFGDVNGNEFFFEFAAGSERSRKLLSLCETVLESEKAVPESSDKNPLGVWWRRLWKMM